MSAASGPHLECDVLVVGWGKAGKSLAAALAEAGRHVVLVEQSAAMYGGSCINVACVPTKLLVEQADRRRPADEPGPWFEAAVARRDTLTSRLRSANHTRLAELDSVTLVDGRARFVAGREVEVVAADELLRVSAGTVVINTGTAPARPDLPGIQDPRVHDSTSIQQLDALPDRLAVVGAGFVGLELAVAFAQFGSRVTLFDGGERLLPGEDPDVAEAVLEAVTDIGVEVVQRARVEAFDPSDVLRVRHTGGDVAADAALLAVGRVPVTEGLGLDRAGVEVDDRGYVVVDDRLRTSADGVFAVGDVNGGPQFTYISYDDHRVVLDQLCGTGERRTTDRVAVPTTTFVSPPFSRVGLTETQAREQGLDVRVVSKRVADIATMPRPKIVGRATGLIKLVVAADSRMVLGARLFCVDSQEMINLLALAMRAAVPYDELRDGIWIHPSSTEALNEVLASLPAAA